MLCRIPAISHFAIAASRMLASSQSAIAIALPTTTIANSPSLSSNLPQESSMLNPTDPPSPTIPVLPTVASPFDLPHDGPDRRPLGLWPGMYHSPVTAALWKARSRIWGRITNPSPDDGAPQQTLHTRSPEETRVSIVYNFTSDYILREQYRNAWNQCRNGKLMEDMDALAGTVAVKHCFDDDSTTQPLQLVTASVDKIHIRKPITLEEDLKMSGTAVWVGRSSMEIRIELQQLIKGAPEHKDSASVVANFKFVARDTKSGKAAPINHLIPKSEEEKQLFAEAESRNARQKQLRKHQDASGGLKSPHDIDRMQALLAEGLVLCDMPALADRNSILMQDTRFENVYICQPQQRNMHGRIFGGFLMRMAFELAFSTCYIFVGHKPLFIEVDRIEFLRPVDVGNFLRFKSCVLYTEMADPKPPLINIEVVAHVTRPESRTSEISNTFYFTFTLPSEAVKDSSLTVRRVVPATEEEAWRVLHRYDADHEDGETMF